MIYLSLAFDIVILLALGWLIAQKDAIQFWQRDLVKINKTLIVVQQQIAELTTSNALIQRMLIKLDTKKDELRADNDYLKEKRYIDQVAEIRELKKALAYKFSEKLKNDLTSKTPHSD